MKALSTGPYRRVGAWLLSLLLFGIVLSGCQAPIHALQELSANQGQRLETLDTQPFPLVAGIPLQPLEAARLRVYLEGDGHAWATASQPSLDPSPRQLLVARLAFQDPAPSIYLARPCQFVQTLDCHFEYWTDKRFSIEVLDSLNHALDSIKQRYRNRDFELIGYSGGAALALLLAAHRDDIAQVQTLAGNLSPRQWVRLQQLSPLSGSLEPLDFRHRLLDLSQRHLSGADDRIVPPRLLRSYLESLGEAACVESTVLPGLTHGDGWEQVWAAWRDRPIGCVP
ncbi:MAG: alpha/beta hydrolase [Halomonas sp.]|nr:alpha/beta hydrolase [Halomonas sp.]